MGEWEKSEMNDVSMLILIAKINQKNEKNVYHLLFMKISEKIYGLYCSNGKSICNNW